MVPLVARWATWLLGLVISLLGGGSERTQVLRLPLAIVTTTLLTLETIALCRLFDRGWPRRRDLVAALVAVDLALGLVLMAVEGGWSTAYYELAMTGVMLPSFLFGLSGMIVTASAFSIGFLAVLVTQPSGDSLTTQLATLLNPWIVGGVVTVLGDLLRRLDRAQARNLELAASEERWRIAREIHDGVAQQSYILVLGLETAVELTRRGDLASLERSLPPLEKLARQALLEVRQYVAEGRPLMLGERSLAAALTGLAREFSTVTSIPVEVSAPDPEPELPASQRNALYRLAQEGLANVFKHAEAHRAWLHLLAEPTQDTLEIGDDGRGLPGGSLSDVPTGFGLDGMRRRVTELGGTFTVISHPGGGTILRASFPLLLTPGKLL
jgi:signal transduction histidine kinase